MKLWPSVVGAVFYGAAFTTSVSASDYPLDVKLIWGIGDRGTTVSISYQIQSDGNGALKVDEKTNAGFLLSQGYVRLAGDEIAGVTAAEKAANLWSLPAKVARTNDVRKGADGIETVLICYSFMSLSEVRGAAQVTVSRECPEDKDSRRAVIFARNLIRMAQKHFPDIASQEMWRTELNSKMAED